MKFFFILKFIGREVYPERSATESKGVQSPLLRKASQKCEAFFYFKIYWARSLSWAKYNGVERSPVPATTKSFTEMWGFFLFQELLGEKFTLSEVQRSRRESSLPVRLEQVGGSPLLRKASQKCEAFFYFKSYWARSLSWAKCNGVEGSPAFPSDWNR